MAKTAVKVKNRLVRGTFGSAWINNEPVYEIKSAEAKVTITYEELHLNGALGTFRRAMSYDVSGTVTLHKVDSRVPQLMGDGPKTGQLPEIKLDFAVADPDVSGVQRATLSDVTLDEFTLAQFENNNLVEESVPFHASGYETPEWMERML